MIDLISRRRILFALSALAALLLAVLLLFLPPEISPSLDGGAELEYRIHAVLDSKEDQALAQSSLLQTAGDTLGLPVTGTLLPSATQEDLWILQLELAPEDSIAYSDYQSLTYALINGFPGWTFQSSTGISQGHGAAIRTSVNYLLCLVILFGLLILYLLFRCRRVQSTPAAAAGAVGLVFCLLGLVSLSAAARIPFDFSTILAAMAVLVFGTYDITAVFAALEPPSSSSPEEWAAALRKAFRDRAWGLTVNTLTTGLVMLAFTVSSYRSDTALLASFAFPLLTGLIFALFAGLILVPLLWYELRFGRHSSQESQPDAEA